MAEIECPECGEKQDESFRYCKRCGKRLHESDEKTCPECGTKQNAEFLFCKNCGASLDGESSDGGDEPLIESDVESEDSEVSSMPVLIESDVESEDSGDEPLIESDDELEDSDDSSDEPVLIESEDVGSEDSEDLPNDEVESPDIQYVPEFRYVKICHECGTKQEEEFKFCKNCGASLDGEESPDVEVCSNCGTQLNGAKFCPECGKAVESDSDVLTCSGCGCRLDEHARFCPECGKPVEEVCPKCGEKTNGADFCSSCGYRLNSGIRQCRQCGSRMDAGAMVCQACGAPVTFKTPAVALALSFLFPGLGQLYNDQNRKAITLVIAYVAAIILCLLLIGVVLVPVIWIYGMYDAFTSAKAINRGEFLEDRFFLKG